MTNIPPAHRLQHKPVCFCLNLHPPTCSCQIHMFESLFFIGETLSVEERLRFGPTPATFIKPRGRLPSRWFQKGGTDHSAP